MPGLGPGANIVRAEKRLAGIKHMASTTAGEPAINGGQGRDARRRYDDRKPARKPSRMADQKPGNGAYAGAANAGRIVHADELLATGRALRQQLPRQAHAEWKRRKGEVDPLVILPASDKGSHRRADTSPLWPRARVALHVLGSRDRFDEAIGRFAIACADLEE